MKKLLFALLIFILASPASATVYKWVDKGGVVNFADDYSKVPPDYRNKVEERNLSKMEPSPPSQAPFEARTVGAQSGKTAIQPPPVSQPLIGEGEFAIKLAEALKFGQAQSEAEAENMLASAGIAPKNGWIGDYPVTPDIIAELEKAIGEAADAKRLPIAKNEALKALRMTALELELPIIAEVPDRYTESPPPEIPQYTEPSVIDNYYYAEGPPVVTYYPPPWDYYYMYAWIPTPFWYSGFYFPGYFILNDFHRVIHGHGHGHGHGHAHTITNHIRDPRTGRISAIDPARRHGGNIYGSKDTPQMRGFNSTGTRNGARSILERSRERLVSANNSPSTAIRERNSRNPAYSGSSRSAERQVYNREGRLSGSNNRNGVYGRPPAIEPRMSRTPGGTASRGIGDMTFNRRDNMNRQSGSNFQRPPTGQTRSFSPSSPGGERFSSPRGSGRSFSPSPQGGNQHFNPPMGSRAFSGSHQGDNRGNSFGQGGGQRYGSSSAGGGGFSGSRQGGDRGSSFSLGGHRF